MALALILFAVAAAGGAYMAVTRLRGMPAPPMALALVHGALAAAGLVALGVTLAGGGAGGLATTATGLFVVAALGGFVLFAQHLRRGEINKPLVLVHGLVAVVSFVILIAATQLA
jgi:hypothetical protein